MTSQSVSHVYTWQVTNIDREINSRSKKKHIILWEMQRTNERIPHYIHVSFSCQAHIFQLWIWLTTIFIYKCTTLYLAHAKQMDFVYRFFFFSHMVFGWSLSVYDLPLRQWNVWMDRFYSIKKENGSWWLLFVVVAKYYIFYFTR